MEPVQLLQEVDLCTRRSLYGIEALQSCREPEFLERTTHELVALPPIPRPLRNLHGKNLLKIFSLTSVSVTKGMRQVSGGTIFAIPNSRACGAIERIYDIGSLNSSGVG